MTKVSAVKEEESRHESSDRETVCAAKMAAGLCREGSPPKVANFFFFCFELILDDGDGTKCFVAQPACQPDPISFFFRSLVLVAVGIVAVWQG